MAMAKRKVAYQKNNQNKLAMVLVSIIVLLMFLVVSIKGIELSKKLADYQAREAELESLIEEQEQYALEIEEYEKYTHTMNYVEDIAKDRLGLVYEGEIVFKEAN